jgi:cobyrinic acid a,c-diamide synthase
VLGVDSHNLDTFLAGEDGVRDVFTDAVTDGSGTGNTEKIAVIEGVMGIYDGMSPGSLAGSSYEIAQITGTPIILVVNAQGVGRTVISVFKGILADDESKLIKGIILNRMSDSFFGKIRPVLSEEIAKTRDDVTILGHIPKTEDIGLESRHLGLKLPGEIADLRTRISRFAEIMKKNCDIEPIQQAALCGWTQGCHKASSADARALPERRGLFERLAPCRTGPAAGLRDCSDDDPTTAAARFRGNTIGRASKYQEIALAVARDEAFCFYYPENLKTLENMGIKLIDFSPLHDAKLPAEANALLLGGGYPELYLEELSRNTSMLESVRNALKNGMSSIAECGGFMYLHSVIEDRDGNPYEMIGAIDGICRYTGHLVNFGYCEIMEGRLAGLRGHEFHYYESTAPGTDATLCKPSTGRTYTGMYISQNCLWGWPHLYYGKRNDIFCE